MIQSANSHVRRLMNEKAQHEEELEQAKEHFKNALLAILTQCKTQPTLPSHTVLRVAASVAMTTTVNSVSVFRRPVVWLFSVLWQAFSNIYYSNTLHKHNIYLHIMNIPIHITCCSECIGTSSVCKRSDRVSYRVSRVQLESVWLHTVQKWNCSLQCKGRPPCDDHTSANPFGVLCALVSLREIGCRSQLLDFLLCSDTFW